MSEEAKAIISTRSVLAQTFVAEFSDGKHGVPAFIIQQIGGTQPLIDQAADLKQLTFEQFMKGFNRMQTRGALARIQSNIIAQHMRSLYR